MYQKIFDKYPPTKDNLIYILHEIQDNHPQNYVSEEAIKEVSDYLRIPTNHIYGVLTFYTMYSTTPRGRYVIRLCESPPCFVKGANTILKALKKTLNIQTGETTADGLFTLELCACLGLCGNAPVMMINNDFYADLNEEKVEKIIKNIQEESK
ncbi:MAG: NADH-quinone oxidoreductase subunit NuoE [Candidatus Cloacimonas sp.]|jgi:NADH-quinone oxidoreductase E subunit|nr:NADH-quinone oxidoreductase subunit NuoE [Candidatus Cloacimonadota bacterium]